MAADPKPDELETGGVEHVDETPEPAPDPAAPDLEPAREPVIGVQPDPVEPAAPVDPVIGPPDTDDELEAE